MKCECGSCKACRHRVYMRGWYRRNREKTIAAVRAYQARNAEKIREQERRKKRRRDPVKQKARWTTSNAIRDGRLIRQPCEQCGAVPAQAHHDDYTKPMEVRWLCTRHHGEVHRTF